MVENKEYSTNLAQKNKLPPYSQSILILFGLNGTNQLFARKSAQKLTKLQNFPENSSNIFVIYRQTWDFFICLVRVVPRPLVRKKWKSLQHSKLSKIGVNRYIFNSHP